MSEDRPLTEFTDAEGDAGDNGDAGGDDATPTVDEETTARADPAPITYRWQRDGATCDRCDATTERQWRDNDEFVCPDCKAW